jgi:hypothetical protein
MRFFLHGTFNDQAHGALKKHEHAFHTSADLPDADFSALAANPAEFLKLLAKKQWQLLTTDAALIHKIYEDKIEFPAGVIVHMLDEPAVMDDQGAAVDRLFDRYKRLTPRRLYTVTASRVKIRQLPGLPV